eukprot:5969638-Amphidinium_carterae.1
MSSIHAGMSDPSRLLKGCGVPVPAKEKGSCASRCGGKERVIAGQYDYNEHHRARIRPLAQACTWQERWSPFRACGGLRVCEIFQISQGTAMNLQTCKRQKLTEAFGKL